jgi:hypothetical protein
MDRQNLANQFSKPQLKKHEPEEVDYMGDPVTRQILNYYGERDPRFFDESTLENFAHNKYMIKKE